MSQNNAKSHQTQATTSSAVSLQDIAGVAIVGNSAPVTLTDGGAIKGSLDLAGRTVETAADLTLGLVQLQAQNGRDAMQAAADSATMGYQFAMDAGRSDVATMQDTTKKVLILVGIVAGAWVVHGWKK